MRRKYNLNLILLSVAFLLTSCHSSPSQNILGSYFPSWMLCALIGIVLTIMLQIVLIKTGIDEFISAKLLVYLSFTVSFTFFIWLIWFGN